MDGGMGNNLDEDKKDLNAKKVNNKISKLFLHFQSNDKV